MEKAEGRKKGADVGGSLAWRSVGHVPLKGMRQHLSFLPGLFPAVKLPRTKPQSPNWAFKPARRSCPEYQAYFWQTSNALQGSHQSKWTFCPWFLFWEEEKSCFSYWWNMVCRDMCCIHLTNKIFGKKQSNLWAYSPFLKTEMTTATWGQVGEKYCSVLPWFMWVNLGRKACIY